MHMNFYCIFVFVYGCKIYAACIDFISLLSGQKFSTSVLPDVNNHLLSWELGNHTKVTIMVFFISSFLDENHQFTYI